MDYVFNEHLDFKPTWSICNTISDNIVIQLIWKFQESNWNPDWFIGLMDSIGTNYIFTNNKNLGQYDQNAIPSQIMPCYSYPGNLINQNKIPIELTCQQARLGLIMSIMSMKMLANMVHMWYSLRWCHVTGILQVCLINLKSLFIWWTKMKSLLSYRAHLTLFMSLTSMKKLTNMTHMQYHPR